MRIEDMSPNGAESSHGLADLHGAHRLNLLTPEDVRRAARGKLKEALREGPCNEIELARVIGSDPMDLPSRWQTRKMLRGFAKPRELTIALWEWRLE